jgi:endonuclease/exonuclease/phosphatase family metal-dependent hydrolase
MPGEVVSALTVATWNVLAAPWAAPAFYPQAMDPALLDRGTRADLVADRILAIDADVLCLQEVTPTDLARLLARGVADRYDHHHVGNGRDLWSHWSTPECPWEPNGTAVLWRHDGLAVDHRGSCELSADGDVATWVALTHRHGTRLRVMSVHLDADDAATRRTQLPVALEAFGPEAGVVDVLAGDCNENTAGTDLGDLVHARGFVVAGDAVGCTDPTHPYARPGDRWAAAARLDHVLVRGTVATTAAVIDTGVWDVATPENRMAEHLRRTGSDHLPVVATLAL